MEAWIIENRLAIGEWSVVVSLGFLVLCVAVIIVARAIRARSFKRATLAKLSSLATELGKLSGKLQSSDFARKQALDRIVDFFDTISRWHDRDAELAAIIADLTALNRRHEYDGVLRDLARLRLHFSNAGRDPYGWNRTKVGEAVTAEKVYLGNIFGLITKTVAYWKTTEGDRKDGWKGGMWAGHPAVDGKNCYEVVSNQADQFMASHIGPIIELAGRVQVRR